MIDPLTRWAKYGEKPDYAGLLIYSGLPYTEHPDELHGADAVIVGAPDELTSDSPGTRFGPRAIRAASCAPGPHLEAGADAVIVGAPMDELTSDSPGTRFGPRAIRAASCAPGPHLEAGIDALREVLRVIDFGDAPTLPADPVRSHAAIQDTVAQVLAAGAIPIILGGDHSIAEPDMRAVAAVHGAVGLIHFDTHTDAGREVFGATLSHGSCMYRLVEHGVIDPQRYVQIGLRGYWPGAEEFGWQQSKGIVSHFMHDVRKRGIEAAVADTPAHVGAGPVSLSVDIDVLDPAFAPGTGTPEPGGMTSADLLWACREVAAQVHLVGMELVEVLPDRIGSRDITALVAERVVRETLTGVALARTRSGFSQLAQSRS